MQEFTLVSTIQTKFTTFNNIGFFLDYFTSDFNQLDNDQKFLYADTYLLQITNCFLKGDKIISTINITKYIEFLTSTKIVNFCSYAMLENYISTIYNTVISDRCNSILYEKVITIFLDCSLYSFIDDHLINFYTYPHVYNLDLFTSIEKYLKHSSIQRLLSQNIRRNNDLFIYYIVLRYQRYFNKSIIINDTNLLIKLNDVLEVINTVKKLFNDYTSLCRDEYNIILEYLY